MTRCAIEKDVDNNIKNPINFNCKNCNTIDFSNYNYTYEPRLCNYKIGGLTPNFVCNTTLYNFFNQYAQGIDPFNYIYPTNQYYNDTGSGVLVVAGLTYSKYGNEEQEIVKLPSSIITNLLINYCKNRGNDISIFVAQQSIKSATISLQQIQNYLDKTKINPVYVKTIINFIQSELINKDGNIETSEYGIYHSGLLFIHNCDLNSDWQTNFPLNKVICSLELWGNAGGNKQLYGGVIPIIDPTNNTIINNLPDNYIVSSMPQLFGCTTEYYNNQWEKFQFVGTTNYNNVIKLFTKSQLFYDNNHYYSCVTISNSSCDNTQIKQDYNYNGGNGYIPAITCETFVMDMIYNLQQLDPINFPSNILTNLNFSDVNVVGQHSLVTDLKSETPNILKYSSILIKYIQNLIPKNMIKLTSIQENENINNIPIFGKQINILLALITVKMIQKITGNSVLYFTVSYKNNIEIIKVTSTQQQVAFIHLIYSGCPSLGWIFQKL